MSLICSTVNCESDFVIAVFFYFYCIFLCMEEGKKEKKEKGKLGKIFQLLSYFDYFFLVGKTLKLYEGFSSF